MFAETVGLVEHKNFYKLLPFCAHNFGKLAQIWVCRLTHWVAGQQGVNLITLNTAFVLAIGLNTFHSSLLLKFVRRQLPWKTEGSHWIMKFMNMTA